MKYKLSLLTILICIAQITFAQNNNSVKGKYLGQKPPGTKPELFAPGIISTKYYEHSAPAFSPDGNTVLWTVIYERGKPAQLLEMRQGKNGEWTKPTSPAFADLSADDFYPNFSADGKTLYFNSRRKVPAGYKDCGLRIWEVEKTATSWGQPVPFDTTASAGEDYAMSVSDDGSVYFAVRRQNGRVFDIVTCEKTNNHLQKPQTLPYNINTTASEDGAFIAADGSYLLFESSRPGGIEGSTDLYISFRSNDGTWGLAKNMGPAINSKFTERFPRVSPDGNYLFFGSDRDIKSGEEGTDIYWVDAKIIETLRKQDKKENQSPISINVNEILPALYANNPAQSATLLKGWLTKYPKDQTGLHDYFHLLRRSNQLALAETELFSMQNNLPDNLDFITEIALIKYGAGNAAEAEKIIARLPAKDWNDRFRFAGMAAALHGMKKYSAAASIYQLALNIGPSGDGFYNMACAYSLNDNRDKAFEALNKAIDYGFKSKEQFEIDADLAPIKSDDRWKALSQRLVSTLPSGDPGKPNKRAHHEMVYDEANKSVLMIGGSTPLNGGQSFKFFNDIWKRSNAAWSKVTNAGDERSGIRLAFDTKRNKLYSYGGFTANNQSSGQLRVLEDGEWKIVSDISEMKGAEPGFVYDASRDKLIAFGGSAGRGLVNNTTWEWDGTTWRKFEGKNPGGRQAFVMVYDSKRKKTILFGGMGTSPNDKFGDTWEFDGTAWTKVAETGPEPRMSSGYAYDSKRGMLIIFGGDTKDVTKGDTWGWDGKEWKRLADTGPAPRAMGYMAYDQDRDRIVLFGGRPAWPNDADDTWEWDGKLWREIK